MFFISSRIFTNKEFIGSLYYSIRSNFCHEIGNRFASNPCLKHLSWINKNKKEFVKVVCVACSSCLGVVVTRYFTQKCFQNRQFCILKPAHFHKNVTDMLLETTNLATSKINWYFFECEFSSALLLSTEPYQLVYAGEIAAKNENQRSSQHRMSKIFWSCKKNHEISSPTFFDQHHFEFFFENKVSERYFDFWLLCPTKQTTAKVLPIPQFYIWFIYFPRDEWFHDLFDQELRIGKKYWVGVCCHNIFFQSSTHDLIKSSRTIIQNH